MGDFTTGTGGAKKTFGGNHAGVDPVLTGKSGNTFGEYANQAAVGSAVEPMGNSNVGISSNQTLASAAANHGLGMAVVDARVELLVPVWVVAGTYTATLTVSALAN
jgi:hypothetical protein